LIVITAKSPFGKSVSDEGPAALHRARGKYLPCLDWIGQALEHHARVMAARRLSVSRRDSAEADGAARCSDATGIRLVESFLTGLWSFGVGFAAITGAAENAHRTRELYLCMYFTRSLASR
jgi:hypothetical protein